MALQTLHQAGLIHCDVHPGNIMLRQGDREPILIDFGSAKLLQPNTYTVTTTVNEGYAPYEQRRKDAEPNAKWDVYGLTATLYFAVTGQKPQTSVDRKLYGDALIAPQKHRSDLSSWLNQAILQGMDLEPDNRPASMQIWLGALHPPQPRIVKPPEPEPVKPAPSVQPAPKPRKNPPAPALPLGALTFLMLGHIPNGILLGLSAAPVGAWAWAWAWALAGAGAGAGANDTGANILLWIGTGGGLVLGAIVGSQTGLGVWAGLGFGFLAVVQFWTIVRSMSISYDALSENYNRLSIFVIWGITLTIGLALGGGIGWLLKLAGVSLLS